MTDHADTIRRAAESEHMTQGWFEFVHAHRDSGDLSDYCVVLRTDALALLAELRQAQEEREQIIVSRDYEREQGHLARVERDELRCKCQQAIDALREIATRPPGGYASKNLARAALVKLGEQP